MLLVLGLRSIVIKTKVFLTKGVNHSISSNIIRAGNFMMLPDLGKYLDIPLLHDRKRKSHYQHTILWAQQRLATWKAKQLVFVGQITLA